MIDFVTVGAGAKVCTVPLNSRRTGYVVAINRLLGKFSNQLLIGPKGKNVFGEHISGELLIPDSLTIHIPLTECDYNGTSIKRNPTNHAPDAVTPLMKPAGAMI